MSDSQLSFFHRLGRLALRVVGMGVAAALAVAGLVLMSGAVLIGAAAAVGLYAWFRLRGGAGGDRVRFGWRTTTMRQRRDGRGPGGPQEDIVDVQVTEVLEDRRARRTPADGSQSD